jgi:hypothetical protein
MLLPLAEDEGHALTALEAGSLKMVNDSLEGIIIGRQPR